MKKRNISSHFSSNLSKWKVSRKKTRLAITKSHEIALQNKEAILPQTENLLIQAGKVEELPQIITPNNEVKSVESHKKTVVKLSRSGPFTLIAAQIRHADAQRENVELAQKAQYRTEKTEKNESKKEEVSHAGNAAAAQKISQENGMKPELIEAVSSLSGEVFAEITEADSVAMMEVDAVDTKKSGDVELPSQGVIALSATVSEVTQTNGSFSKEEISEDDVEATEDGSAEILLLQNNSETVPPISTKVKEAFADSHEATQEGVNTAEGDKDSVETTEESYRVSPKMEKKDREIPTDAFQVNNRNTLEPLADKEDFSFLITPEEEKKFYEIIGRKNVIASFQSKDLESSIEDFTEKVQKEIGNLKGN